MRYFTADLHLGSGHLYKQQGMKFNGNYEQTLLKRFNSVLNEKSILYILGDIGQNVSMIKDFISKLNTKNIIFLMGNHDLKPSKLESIFPVLYGAEIWIGKTKVSLSHYPLKNVFREDLKFIQEKSRYENMENDHWYGESKYGKYALDDKGQFHIHGHTHCCKIKEENGQSKIILHNQIDVGVLGHNMIPVSEKQILKYINIFNKFE